MSQQFAIQKKQELTKVLSTLLTQDKVDNLTKRIEVTIAPFVKKQRDLGKKIASLEISDQKSRDRASEYLSEINRNQEEASEIVDPMIELANYLHKSLTGQRKSVVTLRDENKATLSKKLRVYDEAVAEEQRKRDRAAQEKAAQEERERRKKQEDEARAKRLQDEKEAQAKRDEADKKKREADEAAARARQGGDFKAAASANAEAERAGELARAAESQVEESREVELMTSAAVHDPIDIGHVVGEQVAKKAAESWVDNWKARENNFAGIVKFIAGIQQDRPLAHPELLALLKLDQKTADDMASAQKENLSIPGLTAWNDKFMRGSKR